MARRFELGMSLDYCKEWNCVQAIREFCQNAKDAETRIIKIKTYLSLNLFFLFLAIYFTSILLYHDFMLLGYYNN